MRETHNRSVRFTLHHDYAPLIADDRAQNITGESLVQFKWSKYHKLTAARKDFATKPCIYIQADSSGIPIRIGKAGKGLEARYRGGTGYALDAAMHGSGNLVFVAAVPYKSCANAEAELIWRGRMVLPYNNVGKKKPPSKRIDFSHTGTAPDFSGFESH